MKVSLLLASVASTLFISTAALADDMGKDNMKMAKSDHMAMMQEMNRCMPANTHSVCVYDGRAYSEGAAIKATTGESLVCKDSDTMVVISAGKKQEPNLKWEALKK